MFFLDSKKRRQIKQKHINYITLHKRLLTFEDNSNILKLKLKGFRLERNY